ncbi:MAG: hypothetical protein ACYS9X_20895 [Planctomycetota bacterium]|jgi:hypothetical protein
MQTTEQAAKKKSVVTEFATFAVGIGMLLAVAAYYTLTGIRRAPDLYGIRRSLAIGVPLAVLAGLNLGAGIALFATRKRWAVIFCMTAGILLSATYFFFEVTVIGFLKGKFVSAAIYAVAVLMLARGPKAIEEICELENAVARDDAGPDSAAASAKE